MATIFLIGYMGCGKTTLGRALASRCNLDFIDLDDFIEAKAGMTIRQIFDTQGEVTFREMEREALRELSKQGRNGRDVIVACGGGTPCFADNMELMNACGLTVMLSATNGRLLERLKLGRQKRPLIAKLDDSELEGFITKQLALRMPHYSKATEIFDSSRLEDEQQIAESCREFISRFKLELQQPV